MKYLLLLILQALSLSLFSGESLAKGDPTKICLQNKSSHTYYVSGVDVDNFDWEDRYDDGSMNRPDHNWVNKKLAPSETKCELADINHDSRSPEFSFSVKRDDLAQPVKTRVLREREKGCIGKYDCKYWWEVKRDRASSGSGALHGVVQQGGDPNVEWGLPCEDRKDSDYAVCSRFIIKY